LSSVRTASGIPRSRRFEAGFSPPLRNRWRASKLPSDETSKPVLGTSGQDPMLIAATNRSAMGPGLEGQWSLDAARLVRVINGPAALEIRLPFCHWKRTLRAGPACPKGVIRDILHCGLQHIIRSSGRRWHRGPYPRPIVEVSSGSAINIASEVIDQGHRPRPHRRCCSCFLISRASRRNAHLTEGALSRSAARPPHHARGY
jgi:hypothetical protein